jgi:hypothetical protein
LTGFLLLHLLPARLQAEPAGNADDPYKLPTESGGVPKEVVLYQYEVCPFCNKVKAILDYHKVSAQWWCFFFYFYFLKEGKM